LVYDEAPDSDERQIGGLVVCGFLGPAGPEREALRDFSSATLRAISFVIFCIQACSRMPPPPAYRGLVAPLPTPPRIGSSSSAAAARTEVNRVWRRRSAEEVVL
jgi:hypothetical protein